MRAVVQRVKRASVESEGVEVGRIEHGLLVYLGAAAEDGEQDTRYMVQKISGLRIFNDERGKMARSVKDVAGGVLVISQFTLFGDVRKGLRPSFDSAAAPDVAEHLYNSFLAALAAEGIPVAAGRFRTHMDVKSEVDGPVTICLDSQT